MQFIVLLLFKNEDINSRFICTISAETEVIFMGDWYQPKEFHNQDYSIFLKPKALGICMRESSQNIVRMA